MPTGDNEGDGILFEEVIPCIKTADCLPIFIQGEKKHVLLHAGWRGLAGGIIEKGIEMVENPLFSFIGPSIQYFEVTQEFLTHFAGSPHFDRLNENKWQFDLQAEACQRLAQSLKREKILDSGVCTLSSPWLHSFRRDRMEQRNWNIVRRWS